MDTRRFEISEFSENDRSELRRLFLDVKKETFDILITQHLHDTSFDEETMGEEILVARIDNLVAGFISLWRPDGFIHHLYIRSQYKRMGLGTALIASLRKTVNTRLTLKCIETNTGAVKFYERNGWKTKARGVSSQGNFILFELG